LSKSRAQVNSDDEDSSDDSSNQNKLEKIMSGNNEKPEDEDIKKSVVG